MPNDLRKYKRLIVKDGALAAFLGQDRVRFFKVGDIIDISLGGLSFSYLGESDPPDKLTILEIFGYRDPRLHLEKIPCRIIYESSLADPFGFGLVMKTSRCGVEFGELTQRQLSELESFIKSYADG